MSSIFERILNKEEAMSRLQGQFKESPEDIIKAWSNFLEKGKKAQIGEVREWRGGKYRKTQSGWEPYNPSKRLRTRKDPNDPSKPFQWNGSLTGPEKFGSPSFEENLDIYHFTNSQYKNPDGTWTEERIEKVHKPIVDSYVKRGKKGEGEKPVAILFMGAPATGKGHLRRVLMNSGTIPEHFVTVDPDEIKTDALAPDYDRYSENNNKTASRSVHEEGSDISKEVFNALEEKGYDYIQDKVFSDAKKLEKEIKRLVSKGYDVQIIATQCSRDVALKRMLQRAKKPEARYVPMEIFNTNHKEIGETFDWLMNNTPEGVSSIKRYNTENQDVKLIDQK